MTGAHHSINDTSYLNLESQKLRRLRETHKPVSKLDITGSPVDRNANQALAQKPTLNVSIMPETD